MGALNAIYFLPLLLTNNNRKNLGVIAEGKLLPSFRELLAMLTTFTLTVFAWIFFRAENISHAFSYIKGIFSQSLFSIPAYSGMKTTIFFTLMFVALEWMGREDAFAIESFKNKFNLIIRWLFYLFLILLIFSYKGENSEFIYFQF